MPYMIAVLKETLRIFPPVVVRFASPHRGISSPETGVRYPTHGFMIHSSVVTLLRDPDYWPDVDSFIPERFMTRDESDPLYPAKNARRPF
ncbi:hypothetical protein F4804DRAFT_296579 [Jackrogersella minutella]|nr:hypothetical protein F4804DRAFT_296579 [Jackrogersella minutella]